MPGLANSYLQIMIITVRVVGPAVDVIGADHLHKACGSVDFSSNSSLFYSCVRYNFVAIGDVRIISNIQCFGRVGCRLCEGTREYVRKPPLLSLVRETVGARECGAT